MARPEKPLHIVNAVSDCFQSHLRRTDIACREYGSSRISLCELHDAREPFSTLAGGGSFDIYSLFSLSDVFFQYKASLPMLFTSELNNIILKSVSTAEVIKCAE